MKRLLALAVLVAVAAYVATVALGPAATQTTTVGALQVVQVVDAAQGDPQVAAEVAQSAGLVDIMRMRPDYKNITASHTTYVAGVMKASTPNGFVYETTAAANVWIVEFSGPPQAGWDHVDGYAVVDAQTGKVLASAISGYND